MCRPHKFSSFYPFAFVFGSLFFPLLYYIIAFRPNESSPGSLFSLYFQKINRAIALNPYPTRTYADENNPEFHLISASDR